ncbi:hypothetical protein BDK51DRAFT_33332, partial [Blyttiomyces helicus]
MPPSFPSVYFTLRNHQGELVATGISPPIMITDDHKSIKSVRVPTTKPRKRARTEDEQQSLPPLPAQPQPATESPPASPLTTSPLDYPLPAFASPPSVPVLLEPDATMDDIEGFLGAFREGEDLLGEGLVPAPVVSRVIPGEGPTHGGVEVTLLGSGFYDGLTIMFGNVPALPTHFWSPTTLVCILPPSPVPGPVPVTVKEPSNLVFRQDENAPVFTYKDESDRGLMELALQVLGLRMTGKLEDARNVAMRIVSDPTSTGASPAIPLPAGTQPHQTPLSPATLSAARAALLTPPAANAQPLESLLLTALSATDHLALALPSRSRARATLLHFAVAAEMDNLVRWLASRLGDDIDAVDAGGFTGLHFAAWMGRGDVVRVLVDAGARRDLRTVQGYLPVHLAAARGHADVTRLLSMPLPYLRRLLPPAAAAAAAMSAAPRHVPSYQLSEAEESEDLSGADADEESSDEGTEAEEEEEEEGKVENQPERIVDGWEVDDDDETIADVDADETPTTSTRGPASPNMPVMKQRNSPTASALPPPKLAKQQLPPFQPLDGTKPTPVQGYNNSPWFSLPVSILAMPALLTLSGFTLPIPEFSMGWLVGAGAAEKTEDEAKDPKQTMPQPPPPPPYSAIPSTHPHPVPLTPLPPTWPPSSHDPSLLLDLDVTCDCIPYGGRHDPGCSLERAVEERRSDRESRHRMLYLFWIPMFC